MKNLNALLLSTFLFISFFSCKSLENKPEFNRTYTSITEYLQTIPGIQVAGNDNNGTVRLTGSGTVTTFGSDASPLFVVNGQQVGRNLPTLANILNPNDIKKVKVLKTPDETSFYGINGSNGVIEITTKNK